MKALIIIVPLVVLYVIMHYEDNIYITWKCVPRAIRSYQYHCMRCNKTILVEQGDRYPYKKVLRNFFKKENEKYLPKEKYELIKEYL